MNNKIILLLSILAISLIVGCLQPKPVYKTEYYQDPVYGTLYYGTLTHTVGHILGIKSFNTQNFDNAVSYTMDYSGDTAGGKGYTITLTDFQGAKNYYYQIDHWEINEKPGIIRYDTKSRQVCIENCNQN